MLVTLVARERDVVSLGAQPKVIAKLPAPRFMFGIASGHSVHLHGYRINLHYAVYSSALFVLT